MLKRFKAWWAKRRLRRWQARCAHESQYSVTLPIEEPGGIRWATAVITCDDCGRAWRQVVPAPPEATPVEAYRYKGVWEERRIGRTSAAPAARPPNGKV